MSASRASSNLGVVWGPPPNLQLVPKVRAVLGIVLSDFAVWLTLGTWNLGKQNLRARRDLNDHFAWHLLSLPSLMSSAGDQALPQLTEKQDTHYPRSPQTLQFTKLTPEPPPSTPDLTGVTSLTHTLAGTPRPCATL